jgi:murein DD-endopeptidase MepM/ murein hydrolase activator NlpD
VRFFPSAHRRRLLAAAPAVALTVGVLAVPSLADDDLREKQKQVEQQIDAAQDDLEHASKAVRRASAQLTNARSQLRTARTELAAVRDQLAEARKVDARMQIELTGARHELMLATAALAEGAYAVDQQHVEVKETVTRFYTAGDPQLKALSSYLQANSTEDLMRTGAAEKAIVGSQTAVYADLDAAKGRLAAQRKDVQQARDLVADRRRKAADQLVVVEGLFQDAQDAKLAVDRLVEQSRDARRRAVRARTADQAALKRLEAREKRIRQQILAAAKAAGGDSYNGDTGGLLARPSGGPVTSPFGYRRHPIYGYWGLHNGTDFGAGCGTPAWAGAAGTVIRTYYDQVYGNRLYLSIGNVNGANLTLVYNHLSGFAVSQGTRVKRGQVVGSIGTTGWSTGCHLHFTVLRNGNPVDPMPYL